MRWYRFGGTWEKFVEGLGEGFSQVPPSVDGPVTCKTFSPQSGWQTVEATISTGKDKMRYIDFGEGYSYLLSDPTLTKMMQIQYKEVQYKKAGKKKSLRDNLAALAHAQWSGWMEYLFTKGETQPDGTFAIGKESVERWKRQMETPYADLSEREKDSDRKEADKMLDAFKGGGK